MSNLTKMGVKIRSQKDRIIRMNKEKGWRIVDIARKYNVSESLIYKYFRKWGVQVVRPEKYITEGRPMKAKGNGERKHWKRKFSKEFLEKRAARTKKYRNQITYIKTVNDARDQKLIRNILNRAFI